MPPRKVDCEVAGMPSNRAKDAEGSEDDGERKSKNARKQKKKKKLEVNKKDLENIGALEEEDEVQEGVDWDSDEE